MTPAALDEAKRLQNNFRMLSEFADWPAVRLDGLPYPSVEEIQRLHFDHAFRAVDQLGFTAYQQLHGVEMIEDLHKLALEFTTEAKKILAREREKAAKAFAAYQAGPE